MPIVVCGSIGISKNHTDIMTSSTKLRNFQYIHLELDLNKVLFCPDDKGIIRHEEWKDIPDWEGYYQCSSFGRIKSLKREVMCANRVFPVKERILKQCSPLGYYSVNIRRKNQSIKIQTHRIIALCFLDHPLYGSEKVVDHKDNIKTNNFVWNLQIISRRKNSTKDRKPSSSKYIGVSWDIKKQRWVTRIYFNGKHIHLGYFKDEIEASNYYQNALKCISNGTPIKIKRRTPKSKEPGVYLQKKGKHRYWCTKITISKGVQKFLGSFKTEQEAIDAKREYFKSELPTNPTKEN